MPRLWACEKCGTRFFTEKARIAHEVKAHTSRSVEDRLKDLEVKVQRLHERQSIFRVGNTPSWIEQLNNGAANRRKGFSC